MTLDSAGDCRKLYVDLLKRALTNTIYGDSNISPYAASHDYSEEVRETGRDWPAVAHTMIGLKRLENVQECVERVLADAIPGDLIETGVWRGGASIFMRGLLKAHGDRERTVWVADSFEGLPPPDPATYPADAGDPHSEYAELAISLEEVTENFRRYDLLDGQVRFLKGWFRDTLPALSAEKFAIIRLDGDMYESTIVALNALYSKLSDGGFVIVDDYGAIEGCKLAVDDFRDVHSIFEPIHEADWTGVYWRKATSSDPAGVSGTPCGTIDAIDFSRSDRANAGNQAVIPRGLSASISGWAADAERNAAAGRVLINIDSLPPRRADYGLDRPDVATALANPAYAQTGFRGEILTADLLPGAHTVHAIAVASDGTRLPLSLDRMDFVVEDSLDDYVRAIDKERRGEAIVDELRRDATSGAIVIRGWAADRERGMSAAHVYAVVGSRVFKGMSRLPRPDVCLALDNDAYAHCGYEIRIQPEDIAGAESVVSIRAFTADGGYIETSRPLA